MSIKIKQFIQSASIIIITLCGIPIGRFIQTHLISFGVNFITIGDIIGCYMIPIAILFFVGVWFGAIYLEDKIRTR